MAPNTAVTAAAADVNPEVVVSIAASLRLPNRSPKEVVNDLLERLSNVKRRRELRGLNHWEEYAPTYLQSLAARHERLRVRAIETFFHAHQSKALALAQYWLGERLEAEDAVADSFLKLVSGKTGPSHFYRILRLVCVDRIRARASAGKVFGRRFDVRLHVETEAMPEPASLEIGGGDPLAILIKQEELREGIKEIKTLRKHRQTRALDWWKELIAHHCPDEVVGKQLAQTNM
jgi:DNA-directed RNA polymerase specialized sigma24 family protein